MDPGSMKNDTETGRGRDDGEQTARAIPTAYTETFGYKRRQYMKGNIPSDYEQKYSEDTRYEETGPNARVWRTYQDESLVFDMNMVGQLRDSVDVLLVFAGLFSAVVTSFVAQTYQSLQVDYVQMSASLLFELVAVQRERTPEYRHERCRVGSRSRIVQNTPVFLQSRPLLRWRPPGS
ncbi:hypothetical protein ARMSODRAFT_1022302 [Armillaria solidipes]|uniref:DUF6535 domain-containing protein n=1 Tax=Armillaria solidipes TaxID=1076256 RepID=A0A2H3B3K9_9AGAR|nr:hypothetical protein ARMSODRAFT_1022302 [Armillaria solidipes]